ncbi:MAG: hypothetical protein IH618_11530 [Ignavibacteriaceae bacterium]|nr:hypothetical protein [Ignavibacteriaceae bacterium]
MKKVFIKQLENRLDYLKKREHKIITHEIEGTDLEYGFNRLASLCNPKNKSLFHGYANVFDHNFNSEQKTIIFKLIDEIESSIPVKIFNFVEAIKA